jgi:hypothetical protein
MSGNRANQRQRVSHASGPPSRQRRFGASAVALAEAEAGIEGVPASERVGGSGGAKPPGIERERASASEPRERSGVGVPASERVGGSGGAKPPGSKR